MNKEILVVQEIDNGVNDVLYSTWSELLGSPLPLNSCIFLNEDQFDAGNNVRVYYKDPNTSISDFISSLGKIDFYMLGRL